MVAGATIFSALDAKKQDTVQQACGSDKQACQDKNNNCLCYCGFKPGPRKKIADDTLLFIEDDEFGHHCYCKQRDIDKVKADQKMLEQAIEG